MDQNTYHRKCLAGNLMRSLYLYFTIVHYHFFIMTFSNRFEVLFGPSYDAIVVHTFKNKVCLFKKHKTWFHHFYTFPRVEIYRSANHNNRNNDNHEDCPHHRTQVGEYLERMARYDLMLGVTSAEAFVLLNQEVFNVYIKNDAFVFMLKGDEAGLAWRLIMIIIMIIMKIKIIAKMFMLKGHGDWW